MAFVGNIVSHDYDSLARKLTVYFLTGSKYEFFNVPYDKYDGMLNAESKQRFFNDNIRDVYKYQKIY